MKKLPLGIQNFREIVENDFVYIDKTEYIYNLINDAKYYFLSRPRRFGKSLLLDTIAEAFGGDRELFKGLWIYDSDYGFEKHPVIRLDMNKISNETSEVLKTSLRNNLRIRIDAEGLNIPDGYPSDVFYQLIACLHEKYGKKVVVLIDEYDKPILDHLTNINTADANRRILKGFYGILKPMDPHLKFSMLTGVSKFGKTSVFSELNNLKDITMARDYSAICGIPVDGFERHFGEHISCLADLEDFEGYGSVNEEILSWYDGYSWDGKTRVINPFSLLSFFGMKEFSNYWYASGTPKFLIDMIKGRQIGFTDLNNVKITELMLNSADLERLEIEPLLFQSGYLTVKEVIRGRGSPVYICGIPNNEVKEAFNLNIMAAMTESGDVRTEQARFVIRDALVNGDLPLMLDMLRGLFASIPYQLHVKLEAYYHSIFIAVMNVLGFNVMAEVSVSGGMVDAVLEFDDKVYVVEFKYVGCDPRAGPDEKRSLFNKALDEGMRQIKDKGYHKRYIGSVKNIYLAAFAFLGRDEIDMSLEVI